MRKEILFFVLLFLFSGLRAQQWRDVGGGSDQVVECMFHDTIDDLLYVGGQFDNVGSISAHKVATWDGINWSTFGSNEDFYGNAEAVEAITIFNGNLIVGGLFDSIGNTLVNNIARWDGTQWNAMGDGFDGSVASLQVYNGELYAGGGLEKSGNDTLWYIAKWNGTKWVKLVDGLNGGVSTMCVFNNILTIGGNFYSTMGIYFPANSVVGFDGTNWVSLDSGFTTSTSALRIINDTLYAVGTFSNSSSNLHYIAKWDGQSWLPFPYPSGGTQPLVTDISMYLSSIYVCGLFTNPPDIAKFNGTGYDSAGHAFGYVRRMLVYKNELYVAGAFNSINNISLFNIARFNGLDAINENALDRRCSVFIYPNPISSKNEFRVHFENLGAQNIPLQLCDLDGKSVLRYDFINKDIALRLPEELRSGVYFLSGIDKNKDHFNIKLIVN